MEVRTHTANKCLISHLTAIALDRDLLHGKSLHEQHGNVCLRRRRWTKASHLFFEDYCIDYNGYIDKTHWNGPEAIKFSHSSCLWVYCYEWSKSSEAVTWSVQTAGLIGLTHVWIGHPKKLCGDSVKIRCTSFVPIGKFDLGSAKVKRYHTKHIYIRKHKYITLTVSLVNAL